LDWPSPIVLAFNSCGSFLIVHAATSPTATQESTGGAVSVMCFAVVEFWLMSLLLLGQKLEEGGRGQKIHLDSRCVTVS
jgi:hypothetical protein